MSTDPVFVDRALFFPDVSTLVVADLHLGRDATANVQFPLGERERLQRRLEQLLDQCAPETVVLAGDLLHAFDRLPRRVDDQLEAIEAAIEAAGASPVIVRGNHDSMLDTATEYTVTDYHRIDEQRVVCHGHERPSAEAETYVIGHEHPALTVEGTRRPCYLVGPAANDDATVTVLPAFNTLAPGVRVSQVRDGDLQSPLIGSIDEYRPGVIDEDSEETLWFPELGSLRSHL